MSDVKKIFGVIIGVIMFIVGWCFLLIENNSSDACTCFIGSLIMFYLTLDNEESK